MSPTTHDSLARGHRVREFVCAYRTLRDEQGQAVRLPVYATIPTPLVSWSSRRWFLDDYRAPRRSREASLGKHTELRTDAIAYTPACPTDMGFTAVGQLTPGLNASHSASLSLGRYCIIRLLPDAPSRVLRSCERPCLVDGGFPPSGSYGVYSTNELSGNLTVIDPATHRTIATLPLGKRPRGIRAGPDRAQLYIALSGSPLSPPRD